MVRATGEQNANICDKKVKCIPSLTCTAGLPAPVEPKKYGPKRLEGWCGRLCEEMVWRWEKQGAEKKTISFEERRGPLKTHPAEKAAERHCGG